MKALLIPYFCLGIPILVFQIWRARYDFNIQVVLKMCAAFLTQKRLWTLWYIACLFWLNIFFWLLIRYIKHDLWRMVICVLCTIVGLLYYGGGGQPLPWNVDVCLTAVPFFYAGFYCKMHGRIFDFILRNKINIVVGMIALLLGNLISCYFTHIISGSGLEMFQSKYGCPILSYFSAFCGIGVIVIFSHLFTIKVVQYIGKNSLIYYGWHQQLIMPFAIQFIENLFNCIEGNNIFVIWGIRLLELLFIISILTICTILIQRIKMKFIDNKVKFERGRYE